MVWISEYRYSIAKIYEDLLSYVVWPTRHAAALLPCRRRSCILQQEFVILQHTPLEAVMVIQAAYTWETHRLAMLVSLLGARLWNGGMGVNISGWRLARAVVLALPGVSVGVITVTMIADVARIRLINGDKDQQRALEKFATLFPEAADLIHATYWKRDHPLPVYTLEPPELVRWMTIFGAFAEFWLASDGHDYPVGANALYKVGYPHLDELFGLMLAAALRSTTAASFIVMGAGIPSQIPTMMKQLLTERRACFAHGIIGARLLQYMTLDLDELTQGMSTETRARIHSPNLLRRLLFFPIISTHIAARKVAMELSAFDSSLEDVDGWYVEDAETAGGHNPPPRKDEYGPRDKMDYTELRKFGKPYCVAGNVLTGVNESFSTGATWIASGSGFAVTRESGMRPELKHNLLRMIEDETLRVAPTNRSPAEPMMFQVVDMPNTMSVDDEEVLKPGCNKCFLRVPTLMQDKHARWYVAYMCTADPLYKKRGGTRATAGIACLCNGLAITGDSNVHQPKKNTKHIAPIVTFGLAGALQVRAVMDYCGKGRRGQDPLTAKDVVQYIASQIEL